MKKQIANEKAKIWLKKETRPYRARILFLAFLSVFASLFSVSFAYTVRYLIDSASKSAEKLLWIFSAVLLALLLMRIACKTFEQFYAEKLRSAMTADLRVKTYSKLLHCDFAKAQSYHSGELLTRLTADIQEVAGYSVSLLPAVVGMTVQLVGAVIALFTLDPLFTAIYLVAGCALAGLTALFRKQIKKRQKDVLKADGEFRSFMQESFSSLITVKAYGAEETSAQNAQTFANIYHEKRMKRNRLRSLMHASYSLMSNFGLIFAVVWCSISVLNGNRDYGSILSAILLLMQLRTPLSSFSSVPTAYYARLASGERLEEIYALPEENTALEKDNGTLYTHLQKINVKDLHFSYEREPVFAGANAEFCKGETVCLVGSSGTGKSTLFKLLLSLYAPVKGEIYIEGDFENPIPITERERGLFAYVPQGNFLFAGTIYENLTFFVPQIQNADILERIDTALKIACAEFVYDLPEGLQTQLSERGGGLSEGQLQRLAIARALLSERSILLLDEATSALDTETERGLLENIKGLKNRTCLIVTHRLAALEIADRVLCIENKQIVEKTEL